MNVRVIPCARIRKYLDLIAVMPDGRLWLIEAKARNQADEATARAEVGRTALRNEELDELIDRYPVPAEWGNEPGWSDAPGDHFGCPKALRAGGQCRRSDPVFGLRNVREAFRSLNEQAVEGRVRWRHRSCHVQGQWAAADLARRG